MNKYEIFIDVEYKTYATDIYHVEAETEEEAKTNLLNCIKKELTSDSINLIETCNIVLDGHGDNSKIHKASILSTEIVDD